MTPPARARMNVAARMEQTPTDTSIEAEFESRSLELLASRGFLGEASWLAGRLGETYVVTCGKGSTRRLLIHGGMSELSEWGPLAARLGGHIALADRPGCGLSYRIDYTRAGDFRAAAAAWVEEVVDGLGDEQVDLVGNSMGGYFATAFALEHPDRVRRLVLLGAPAGLLRSLPLFLRLWGNPVSGQLIRRMQPKDPEQLRKRAMAALVAHPERLSDEYLRTAFLAGRLPGAGLAAYTMLRTVTDLRGWRQRLLVGDALLTSAVPTLFAWGARDSFLPASVGRSFAERMPDAHFAEIIDAGHMPQLDQPEQVATVVNQFLGPGQ